MSIPEQTMLAPEQTLSVPELTALKLLVPEQTASGLPCTSIHFYTVDCKEIK